MNIEDKFTRALRGKLIINEEDDPETDSEYAVSEEEESVNDEEIPVRSDPMQESIVNVMTAYQNANKWFDTLKEDLYHDKGLFNFSEYIHNLAHTMPVRFDKFGDILHTHFMLIPYPATEELHGPFEDVGAIISIVMDCIEAINKALIEFIRVSEENGYKSLSIQAEDLLVDINTEREPLIKMLKIYEASDNLVRFDNWVGNYMKGM